MHLTQVATLAVVLSTVLLAQSTINITDELPPRLSPGSSIITNTSSAPRWSDYAAPQAGFIVNVAEQEDVAEVVRYCNSNNLRFLAQSGANGWANTFNMDERDVIINLRGLNSIDFNENFSRARLGGGVLNGELVEAAYENGLQVLNGGCNCVGILGSALGGGVSRFMNYYGLPADNIMSATLVTAAGDVLEVSGQSNTDILWAIRGAGPNFGIITSVEMNVYPTIDNGSFWAGQLTFNGDEKLQDFIEAIQNLNLTERMAVLWGFSYVDEQTPAMTAQISYVGADAEAGRSAFQALFDLGPDNDTTQVIAYNHMNDDTIELCERGGRKPGWHSGLRTLDYEAWQDVWDEWVNFVNETGISTTILVESYSNYVVRSIGSANASYPHRDINFYAWTIPFWEDPSQDPLVENYGRVVRDIWRNSSGFDAPRAYINFAHGDEPLEEIYGESLPRLRQLKQQYDPDGRFNQWFPIS